MERQQISALMSRNLVFMSLGVLLLGTACGTRVGNPDQASAQQDVSIPSVDFSVPQGATSGALTDQELLAEPIKGDKKALDIILVVSRTDRVIQDLNSNLDRLREEGVTKTGPFAHTGAGGEITGVVKALDDATYKFSATVCSGGKPFYLVKWNADGSAVSFIRDFSLSPVVPGNKANGFVEVAYKKTSNLAELNINFNGEPWDKPGIETLDGPNLAESIHATKDDSSNYQFREAADWYAGTLGTPEGDYYVAGKFSVTAKGESLAYRKNHPLCPKPFTEADTDNPGWCLGNDLDGNGFKPEDLLVHWTQTLKAFGVEPMANIHTIALPAGLTCE